MDGFRETPIRGADVATPAAAAEVDPDRSDFADFYRCEWTGAVRLAGLLTQDAAAAEDLAQEAFTRMYPKWDRAEFPKAYLRTTVVNVCQNWQRRNRTERVKLPLVAVSDTVAFESDDLADAVATLPFRQRAVLVLRFRGDLSS